MTRAEQAQRERQYELERLQILRTKRGKHGRTEVQDSGMHQVSEQPSTDLQGARHDEVPLWEAVGHPTRTQGGDLALHPLYGQGEERRGSL